MVDDATWRIRLAGPGDTERIVSSDVFDGPAQAEATRRFLGTPDQSEPRAILMLAEQGGSIIGFASGIVTDHPDKPSSLFIVELGVNESARRHGIARALLSAIRAEGRARGCRSSWVLTEGDNTAARALCLAAAGAETSHVAMFDWDETKEHEPLPLRPPLQPG